MAASHEAAASAAVRRIRPSSRHPGPTRSTEAAVVLGRSRGRGRARAVGGLATQTTASAALDSMSTRRWRRGDAASTAWPPLARHGQGPRPPADLSTSSTARKRSASDWSASACARRGPGQGVGGLGQAGRGEPERAVRWTKRALNNWLRQAGPIFDQSLGLEMLSFMGPDVREGARAIREKRPPRFPSGKLSRTLFSPSRGPRCLVRGRRPDLGALGSHRLAGSDGPGDGRVSGRHLEQLAAVGAGVGGDAESLLLEQIRS